MFIFVSQFSFYLFKLFINFYVLSHLITINDSMHAIDEPGLVEID